MLQITVTESAEIFHTNPVYSAWIERLIDSEIFATDARTAYPYTPDTPITFTITTPDTTLKEVYFNDQLLFTTTERVFDVQVYPVLHEVNSLYVIDTVRRRTPTIYFTVYNLHFFVFVVTSKLRDIFDSIQQSHIDRTLSLNYGTGLLGSNEYSQSNAALTRMFGQPLQVSRINDTKEEYRNKLQNVLNGFHYCGTVFGFKEVLQAFASGNVDFITYRELEEFRTSANVYLHRTDTLEIGWFPAIVEMNNRKHFIDYGTMAVPSGDSSQFIYIDGSTDVNGYQIVKTAAAEPVGSESVVTEQFDTFLTDDDEGTLTGLAGGRFVILSSPVISLSAVSSDGTVNPEGAEVLESSKSILFLRTDADDDEIGTVTVQYIAYNRPLVLGLVKTSSDIWRIEEPVPTRGAIYREQQYEESDFEMFVGNDALTDEEIAQLLEILKEVSTVTGRGHLWVKKLDYEFAGWIGPPHYGVMGSSAGYNETYEYHKLGYRYVGLV